MRDVDREPWDWRESYLEALRALDDEYPGAIVLPMSYEIRRRPSQAAARPSRFLCESCASDVAIACLWGGSLLCQACVTQRTGRIWYDHVIAAHNQ